MGTSQVTVSVASEFDNVMCTLRDLVTAVVKKTDLSTVVGDLVSTVGQLSGLAGELSAQRQEVLMSAMVRGAQIADLFVKE